MESQINVDGIINEILKHEGATFDDVDEEALKAFKINCDYIDIICGHHETGDRIDVDFSLNEEKDVVVRMRFEGKPHTELMSYKLLIMGSLDDKLIQGAENRYLFIVTLGSFIKY